MISSKKITTLAVILTALALVFTLGLMMLPRGSLSGQVIGVVAYSDTHSVAFGEDDYYKSDTDYFPAKIQLNGTTAASESKNVSVSGGDVTILGGGTYILSGTLTEGSIIVDSADGAEVRLFLNGASITSSDFSALYVKQAEKTVISLVPGTENALTDGSAYSEEKLADGKPTAALYTKDDLTINGSGSLTVTGHYQDGIKANDGLKVTEGTLNIRAADEGINVNDYLAVLGAELTVSAGGDAVKCEHESPDKGFVVLDGTRLTAESQGDGVSASSAVYIKHVTADVVTGGGSETASAEGGMDWFGGRGGFGAQTAAEDSPSAKGIKAGTRLELDGGVFHLDCADDGIHSDGDLAIAGGQLTLSAGDDAVHGEKAVVLAPESLRATKCREGIEGATITINSGDIFISAADDGINAVGENARGGFGGRPGMGGTAKTAEEDIYLTVNGGDIVIEAAGDGFDSNGSAVMSGGSLRIYGPENDGNGSIDVGDGGYVLLMNGGSLLAAGSSGMAEAPYEGSAQSSLVFYLEETHLAGSRIVLLDESGNEIMSGESSKRFDWVCVSDAGLETGKRYVLTVDGTEAGEAEVAGSVTTSGSQERRGFR